MAAPAGSDGLRARYQRAVALLPSQMYPRLADLDIAPQWRDGGRVLRFRLGTDESPRWYELDLASGQRRPSIGTDDAVPRESSPAVALTVSPNGKWGVRSVEGNLVRVAMGGGSETPLTSDAAPDWTYASMGSTLLGQKLEGAPQAPNGLWSPDGTRFLTYRVDERATHKLPIVVNTVPGAKYQVPWVHFQNTNFPDQPRLRAQLMIFDMASGGRIDLQTPGAPMEFGPVPVGGWHWSADGRNVFVAVESEDYRSITLYEADAATGAARDILTESSALTLRPDIGERFQPLGNGAEILLYSERSDWGHFYLYDGHSGQLKRALTRGDWAVHGLARVDEVGRWLYFTAGGREPGRDPYYTHLYRVSLDGGEPQLLTPEDAQHSVSFAPDGRHFVDRYSTVDSAPVSVLRTVDGRLVAELAKADLTPLHALGWKAPRRFSVKAADGITDLYGVMYLPADLDERASYPIIDFQYTGPHRLYATRSFRMDREQALAQLGFVVISVDGRATPLRRQSMQDLGFAEKQSAPLLVEDHKVAMEQLARRHGFIDIGRVGVFGQSAGGYRTVRAMLQFPEFYKVGVAFYGSHDAYVHESLARFYGRPQDYPEGFAAQSNMPLANRLKGKLLLTHGDVDDNVHVGITLQMADALIRADKEFDMFIYPGRGHDIAYSGYMTRIAWNYFIEHLLGQKPLDGMVVPDP